VVNADRDPISHVSRLRGFVRATVPLDVVVMERTGHMPMLERPDAFNAEVGAFWTRWMTDPTDGGGTQLGRRGAPTEFVAARGYLKDRSRRLLVTTKTEEKAIAAPAIIGLSMPKAASGRAATL